MFKQLWHSFVPTSENDYRPYFLRAWPVAVLLVVIVGLYGGAQWAERSLSTPGSSLAAVIASVLVDLTNGDRAQNDLSGLAVSPTLQQVAQAKADDMALNSYFAHTSPAGKTPWYWFDQEGYKFSYAGENLAVYFTDSADVERAWMNSPGHRANLLSPHFTEIGIATAQGVYQGQPTTFVVQEFGAPVKDVPLLQTVALPASQGGIGTSTASTTKPAAKPPAPKVKGAATSTPSSASGPPALTVIHEDPQFIAVKNASTTPAPTTLLVTQQSTVAERMLASPKTSLAYVYTALALLIIIALIFLIVFEIKKQRPMNILYAVLLIALIIVLLYLSQSHVLIESAQAAFFPTSS